MCPIEVEQIMAERNVLLQNAQHPLFRLEYRMEDKENRIPR